MISPPPSRDNNLTSQAWQKWFNDVYEQFKNINTQGDTIIDSESRGVVLKDGAGVYWRVTINTTGSLTTTNLGTTRPQGI